MASFGRQLRRERERRGLARSEVAEATSIYIHDLAALEFEDFSLLPDDDVVEGFVRTYAAHLGVDADEMVADYRRSRADRPAAEPVETHEPPAEPEPESPPAREPPDDPVAEATGEVVPEERPVSAPSPPARSIPIPRVAIAVAAVAVVTILIGWGLAGRGPDEEPPGEGAVTGPSGAPEAAPDDAGPLPQPEVETPPPPTSESGAVVTLVVTEHGVGTGVVDRRLVGESDRFVAGTRVWFWTRVVGGARGASVDHVWTHEGREVDRIALDVGSANWRTHSAKRIYETGRWAVEARDPAGAVLARGEFDCVAK